MDFFALGALGIMGFCGYATYHVYNRLMALDERCLAAYSDIDVLLKHRHTLIPGLIETVKGYVNHEREMLNSILRAQVEALQALNQEQRMSAEVQLGNNLHSFLNFADKLPELRASTHFVEFRNELTNVENKITAARRFYNLTVAELNSTVRQFPGSLLSGKAGVNTRKTFDLGVERMLMDDAVEVKF